jgi:HD-like signal output (HDOD) protein
MTDVHRLARTLAQFPNLERLPSPGPVALRLSELANRVDVTLSEFVRTLRSDPALTGRVLKFANSAAVAARRATSIDQAVVRIGLGGVRRLALAFSVVDGHRTGPCAAFDYQAHWAQSLARAIAAEQLAKRGNFAPPEDCFTLGLLSGIGSLALATVHPGAYSTLLTENPWSEQGLLEAESLAFGLNHRELSALLLLDWRLPPPLVNAAVGAGRAEVDSPARHAALCGLFACAESVAEWCLGMGLTPLDPGLPDRAGLPQAEIDEIVDVTTVQWADWKADFEIGGTAR